MNFSKKDNMLTNFDYGYGIHFNIDTFLMPLNIVLLTTENESYTFIKTKKNMNRLYKRKLEIMVCRTLNSLIKSRKIGL